MTTSFPSQPMYPLSYAYPIVTPFELTTLHVRCSPVIKPSTPRRPIASCGIPRPPSPPGLDGSTCSTHSPDGDAAHQPGPRKAQSARAHRTRPDQRDKGHRTQRSLVHDRPPRLAHPCSPRTRRPVSRAVFPPAYRFAPPPVPVHPHWFIRPSASPAFIRGHPRIPLQGGHRPLVNSPPCVPNPPPSRPISPPLPRDQARRDRAASMRRHLCAQPRPKHRGGACSTA